MTAAQIATEPRERLRRRLIGALGPVLVDALKDPAVVEVIVNADGGIWLETHDEKTHTGHFLSRIDRRTIIALVADAMDASAEGGELAADFPSLDGSARQAADRFQAIMPPVTEAEVICIRRHAGRIIPLGEYVARGIVSAAQAKILREAVAERQNIVIAGGTGSGKTTLANALLNEPGFADGRIITIEDRRELQLAAQDRVQMLATGGTTIRDLVQRTLRLRPDRIVVGEVRDGAMLDVLKAWNTGHPGGLLTIHADGAMEALERIEELIAEVSADPQRRMIGRAVDLIVSIAGRGSGRRVREIVRVIRHDGAAYVALEMRP
jgi:type IV secretion system protein TrbB